METVESAEVERLRGFIGLGEFQAQIISVRQQQESESKSQKDLDSIGHRSSLGSQKG